MKTFTLLKRGFSHENFCEDFVESWQKTGYTVAVVCDGCSSGKASHFAAHLQGKLIGKVLKKYALEGNVADVSLFILEKWIEEFKEVRNWANLATEELLATLILLVDDQQNSSVRVLGDGVVCINKQIEIIDQNNAPDYAAFHLDDSKEEILTYLQKQHFYVSNVENIAISSDGIQSFMNRKNPTEPLPFDVVSYFLSDDFLINTNNMLQRKFNILASQHQLEAYDDLSMVRLIK